MDYCYTWIDFNSHPRLRTTSRKEIRKLLTIDTDTGIFNKLESAKGSQFTSYYNYIEFVLAYYNNATDKEA